MIDNYLLSAALSKDFFHLSQLLAVFLRVILRGLIKMGPDAQSNLHAWHATFQFSLMLPNDTQGASLQTLNLLWCCCTFCCSVRLCETWKFDPSSNSIGLFHPCNYFEPHWFTRKFKAHNWTDCKFCCQDYACLNIHTEDIFPLYGTCFNCNKKSVQLKRNESNYAELGQGVMAIYKT